MHRIRITVVTALLSLAAALLTGVDRAAAAPASYGPAVPLVNCSAAGPADAAIASDGSVRAFVNCASNGAQAISFVRFRGMAIFAQPTPYRGRVIKVVWDDLNSAYLLFARPGPDPASEQLFIGKRLENTGQYAPPTLLSTISPGGGNNSLRPVQATLAAYRSTWWAIWTEPTADVAGTLTYSLFQRHTLLAVRPRTRITYPIRGADDSVPSLAYSPRSPQPVIGLLTVVWFRSPYLGAPRAQLRLGQEFGFGWLMAPERVTVAQDRPVYVDHISYMGTRHLTWPGTRAVGVATYNFGRLVPHTFPADSDVLSSTVAASAQNLFLMWWTRSGPHGPQVILAEREAGTWSHAGVLPGASEPVRVLAQGGKGRLLYWSAGTLTLRVQN